MPELTTIGLRLKQARRLRSAQLGRDVNQAEVAEAVGMGQAAVSRWEAGSLEPNIDTIRVLALFLGVSPAWLAFGEDEEGPQTPLRVAEPRPVKPAPIVKIPKRLAKKGKRKNA